ncbi:MAG: hypothetical protein L3K02_02275 [Thermoplasmata archaeon]|nr:hypothetical protein [Thermoplasmata archaeon]
MTRSSGPTRPNGSGGAPTVETRIVAYLRARPILCLAILTPGIPEYLSTSSPVLALVTNPAFFFLQLAINVGQYTAGALLIREAMIRWHKGWGSVLLLGLAYGVTEEGLGDNTLFNTNHAADGVLGSFGHWVGVNWVWATAVLAFHVIFSIGLPILLLSLALPATRGRSLLGRRGLVVALASLAATTATETLIVYNQFHFWMGPYLLIGSGITIAALVVAAYRLPRNSWAPPSERPSARSWEVGAIGFLFFPIAFVLEYGFTSGPVPPAVIILGELVIFGLLFERIRRRIGRTQNEYLLVDLAFGSVLWQAVFGVLLTLGLPFTLPLVAITLLFFFRLQRAYPDPASAAERNRPPTGTSGVGDTG